MKTMTDATKYNQTRGYTRTQILLVQEAVGATEDGKIGPATTKKVAEWQSAHGLKPDGKVGPQTWQAIQDASDYGTTLRPCAAEIGCGLAAYDQSWPNRPPELALQKAFDAAIAEGCTEIRYWSSEWLVDESIPGGGNKGNTYSGPWLAKQKVPDGVTIGAWIDDPAWSASKDEFAARLAEMGITRAALMINRSNTRSNDVPWEMRWEKDELVKIAKVYAKHGIQVIATTWPRPSMAQIDAMCEDMKWVLEAIESNVFEVDTEGNWHKRHLDVFTGMRHASQYLADRMRDLVGSQGELELTTFTYHGENSGKALLAPLMDRLLPQAYSVRHRDNETVPWDSPLGPGRHQSLATKRARQAAA